MQSEKIRKSFLDFFKKKGHTIVPSSSLLPEAPNLLFTNAGMNPLVPYFLGERKPIQRRITDTQKCIRAGGKHNDLEVVGFDTYHHTFFEMLGNWSLGDYFKQEAIEWAWELLTQVWKFPKERLYATIYKPDAGDPAEFDKEAYHIWEKIFNREKLDPQTHIVPGSKKDNFWMMGDTGPCGPCSEIHIDLTPNGGTQGCLVNHGDAYCIEIWNLVFIQYNALPNGQLDQLKNQFVDTGMGFERVAGIFATTNHFQDFSKLPSNYDSDLFTPLFDWLQAHSGHTYGGQIAISHHKNASQAVLFDCAFRLIADHIRTLSFAIADGILPGNEGRHYVLRRIIRRAVLFGHKLKLSDGFLSELSRVITKKMGDFFPELKQNTDTITKVLKKEEAAFNVTLERGLNLFENWVNAASSNLSGEQAFLLYDTYGFPIDLMQLMAQERGLFIDMDGFRQAMKAQKNRAKAAVKKSLIKLSDTSGLSTKFVGYESTHLTHWHSKVTLALEQNGHVYISTQSSPFYGEKGGQIGDCGQLQLQKDQTFDIVNTIWQHQILLHEVDGITLQQAQALLQKEVILSVDVKRRLAISRHHSATHLLHWALRQILGLHVCQAGSTVTDKKFRFDFSHFEKIPSEQLEMIERLCNEKILTNAAINVDEIDFHDRPAGCLAFFEEKYGDRVRMVSLGDFSQELCSGTHASATGELGQFKILQETSVASGLRRIEAVAGLEAFFHHYQLEVQHQQLEQQFGCSTDKIFENYQLLLKQKKHAEALYRQLLQQDATRMILQDKMINGLHWVQMQLQAADANNLRSFGKSYFSKQMVDILWVAGENEKKGLVFVFCSEKAISKNVQASILLKKFLKTCGANGGGKPNFASGGVKDATILKNQWPHLSFENI